MAIEIRILERDAFAPPPGWPEGPQAPHPQALGTGDEIEWQKLCLQIVKCSQRTPGLRIDVFICLFGDEALRPRDRTAIKRLLVQTREHCWGARIFLVIGQTIDLRGLLQDGRESARRWMETVLMVGVFSLLQIDYLPVLSNSLTSEKLRLAADKAEARESLIAGLQSAAMGWKCVMPARSDDRRTSLLGSLIQAPTAREQSSHLVVVVDSPGAKQQAEIFEAALKQYPDREILVVTLKGTARGRLEELCERDRRCRGLLELRGDFELWYLLLRLNEPSHHRGTGFSDLNSAGVPEDLLGLPVEAVTLDTIRLFPPLTEGDRPVLLVTCGFDPEDSKQCLEASYDVGWFLEAFPRGLEIHIEPAITLDRLFQVLDKVPRINVWIHLGHGHERYGLTDTSTTWIEAWRWLQAFEGRDFRLQMVMFLACHSAGLAESFTRAGARLGIGFRNAVESSRCRQLAVEVLKALFREGGSPPRLLQGFRLGWSRLQALQEIHSQAVAYYLVETE